MDDSQATHWIAAGICSVVGGLAAAVTALWKLQETKNAKRIASLEERAADCERDRTDLRVRIAQLEIKMKNAR